MDNSFQHKSIFQQNIWVSIFALTAAVVWGWAYPLIKMGFAEFGIQSSMTESKMLFAGIRFFFSGLIILLLAKKTKRSFRMKKASAWWLLGIYALVNTTLHYTFFYLGLSYSAGSRAAIYNSLSVFAVVIFAGLFYKQEKLTGNKVLGCLMGFIGILFLHVGNAIDNSFIWQGDGMIILNALCGATATLMTRRLSKHIDIFVGTGYSLTIGGFLLLLPAWAAGGNLPIVNLRGLVILGLLIGVSTIGFGLYNKLLSCNPIGKVAIYNSLIPIVGVVTSCLCLHESFLWQYCIAGILTATGIYIINREKN